MSVVGFDFGNESCVVAIARQRGIDVVLNDESKCETPSIVCFGEKQRFFGTAGATSNMMNPKNTISQIKRLIGCQFSDPELQRDLKSLPYLVTEGPDGYPLIRARYLGETRTFTPTQVLGMVLSNLKSIAEKNLNAAVVDCCIGIPVYFTDLQRRAVIDAATIAGLNPLRLIHETTATALAYGVYKTDLPENEPMNVAFVDVGHANMQVCIAAFRRGQMKILAHSFDRSLGGRDFDEVLFQHFAAKFNDEYKMDVCQNLRACLRLRAACEKLKKVLSANPEAPLNIECLMDEKDVRGLIKREEFEQISIPILERVKKPLEKALVEAGLTIENIHSIEVVGSGSRVPAIIKTLTEFFGKQPRRTMNAKECIAKGSALECAILSPTFRVREFQVNESFLFPIALSWKGSASDTQSTVVFPKCNPIPSVKALTFYRSGTFTIDVQYADASELQAPAKISTYTIGPFQFTKGERAKIKVKVRLNLHGIVSIELAMLLEAEEVKLPAGVREPVEAPKEKVRKTNLPVVEVVYGGLAAVDVQKAVEKEFEMALQDRIIKETKDKKNAVEDYVYEMRNKLHDKYHEFVKESDKNQLISRLQEMEDWLYEDGKDETKGAYIAKLDELKKQGDPIEQRYMEHMERGSVIGQLFYCINSYRGAVMSNDPKFDHIDFAEKQMVLNECVETEAWLREKEQHQDSLPKYATPVLLSADVRKKTEALDRFCRPVMTKPKPVDELKEVTDALARAGLQSSNLIVGIDFTKSNEWTGARSFHRRSLHHIGDEQNPYEQAISIIGRTLSKFNEDNLIPCYGFGDASTHDQEVFSFFPDERFCDGFEEVLSRYRELVPQLRLAGPTSFAPVIEMAITIVKQSGGRYHVLLIIADGQVTRSVETDPGQLSRQEKKTVEAIVKASEYPLSIVLVGVGDGPWDMMREFNDNIPARAFDNFQFVNLTEIMSKNLDQSRKEAEFAFSALMGIPSQYKATVVLNILGACRGKGIDRVALPPPLYGATSFSSAESSSSRSFSPGASSSSERDPVARTSQSGSYVTANHQSGSSTSDDDDHLCPICISERKNMALGCGHQTCCECGQDLSLCPICRKPIDTRIKLY